jgi:phage terminase large subunit GpA-like protein
MTIAESQARALASLLPPPRLQLSRWIEANIHLPEVSAQPGPMRLWPWQPAIADAIGDSTIERVTLLKPSRVGFTALVVSGIGAFIVNEPSAILVLLPTESDTRDFIVSDVEPTFDASPALRQALSPDREGGERDTLTSRKFVGGSLKIVASKAPRNLRRHAARILIVDEADACEVGAEGDPIRLAEQRTLTYSNRKIIIGSTPIFAETSAVLRSYDVSDRRIFECPCPRCGAYTEIQWSHIIWPEGKPEDAAFQCPHCKEMIVERFKPQMVGAGQWRATRPEVQGHAGFRLNSLISLLANATWGKLAQEFLTAKDDPSLLQVFSNVVLAQGWSVPSMVDENALAARAEDFGLNNIPREVLVVTCGADVQDDRVEISICGWSRDSTCWILGHIVIWGSFQDVSTWDEVDEVLRTKWRHPLGGRIGVDAAIVDMSDGDHTDVVINFCLRRRSKRVFAGKGLYGARPGFAMAKNKASKDKFALVGVDGLKNVLFDRLQRGQGIRFSKSLEPIFYEQLASERRVIRYVRGQPTRRFERIGKVRNEALDCMVYAFAARQSVSIIYDRREAELRNAEPPKMSFVHLLAR